MQALVPACLKETPQEYYDSVLGLLKKNANYCLKRATAIPALTPVKPQGAMYMMAKAPPLNPHATGDPWEHKSNRSTDPIHGRCIPSLCR